MMPFDRSDTAVVVIDPHNDGLNENSASWPLVGASVRENRTIENLERIFKAAKTHGYRLFISPHYYYPSDDGWQFREPLGRMMHEAKLFHRAGPLTLQGFA